MTIETIKNNIKTSVSNPTWQKLMITSTTGAVGATIAGITLTKSVNKDFADSKDPELTKEESDKLKTKATVKSLVGSGVLIAATAALNVPINKWMKELYVK